MSHFQYDLNDLLNFDLGFEFDDFDFGLNKGPHTSSALPGSFSSHSLSLERESEEISRKHGLDLEPAPFPPPPVDTGDGLNYRDEAINSTNIPGVMSSITPNPSSTNCNDIKRVKAIPLTAQNKRKPLNKSKDKKTAVTTALKQPPPPIPRSDVRYTYPRLFLNAFNSGDPVKLSEVLCTYATEDVVSVHRYEGGNNPYARNYTRLDGRQTTIQMWIGLFKSAPDFFFDLQETRAFHSPDWNLIIAARFNWVGTRVSDVSLTRSADHERMVQKSIFASTMHMTQDEEQRERIEEEKRRVLQTTAHANANSSITASRASLATHSSSSSSAVSVSSGDDISGADSVLSGDGGGKGGDGDKKAVAAVVVESVFQGKDQLILLQGEEFRLESKPCARKEIRCTGRILLHLNCDNKISKIEFVYTATPTANPPGSAPQVPPSNPSHTAKKKAEGEADS